jgi:SAM-dependent methyltransferase
MDARVYEQFDRLQKTHFWFRGRRAIFFHLLDQALQGRSGLRILEIGCGAGGMLEPLRRYGTVHGIDIARDYMALCRDRGFPRMAAASGDALPYGDATFDVVALFDVIEHIPDEVRVLLEVRRVLKPGGIVFISVPAYQFLFSQNDRVVHHQRRYTARALERRIGQAGLRASKVTYFNTFLFPLIIVAVLVLKAKERLFGLPRGETNLDHEFQGPVNDLLSLVMSSERHLLRHIDFPFGHSLIAMAR